jgi:transcriptional regulator with XRE-family HTH domain
MLTSRLKEARLRAGLSQERLGTLAGLDEMSASSRMNQYERGKHTPGFFLIERLAAALHMPAAWFYTRDDDMAELLLAYHRLPAAQQRDALAYVRGLAAVHGTPGPSAADGLAASGAHSPGDPPGDPTGAPHDDPL